MKRPRSHNQNAGTSQNMPLKYLAVLLLCLCRTDAWVAPVVVKSGAAVPSFGSPQCSSACWLSSSQPYTATRRSERSRLHIIPRKPAYTDAPPTTQQQHAAAMELWESMYLVRFDAWYRRALAIKCPFLRRRAADTLDALEQVLRFVIIRHKSLPGVVDELVPPVAFRCHGDQCVKERNLPTTVVMERIRQDWKTTTNKGYYITGRLSTELYRDDCLFDGPDPDMPVRGLRKYLQAASQLFEYRTSTAVLLQLKHDEATDLIHADWRIQGVLRLPWKPALPTWHGTTTYHRDEQGLIYKHTETWELSVVQAFGKTLWPSLAARLWPQQQSLASQAAPMDEECPIEAS